MQSDDEIVKKILKFLEKQPTTEEKKTYHLINRNGQCIIFKIFSYFSLDKKDNLVKLFENIIKLKHLKELVINGNKLAEIPDEFSHLQNLEILELKSNNLKQLTNSIADLKLNKLLLNENQFQEFPKEIEKLNELEVLFLPNNHIIKIPDSIKKLKKLKILNLGFNQISDVPESFTNLNMLTRVHLHDNNISSLPNSLDNMEKLSAFDLRNNKLKTLPESICNMKRLSRLYLSDNPIESLPTSMETMRRLSQLGLQNTPIIDTENYKFLLKRKNLTIYGLEVSKAELEREKLQSFQKLVRISSDNIPFSILKTQLGFETDDLLIKWFLGIRFEDFKVDWDNKVIIVTEKLKESIDELLKSFDEIDKVNKL
ncbi:MAG: leucine-rich repeat domain-containing protein [Candidatus Hodarchaeales archaeon]|jgi:Leucine-rich repeat (LRR) protein